MLPIGDMQGLDDAIDKVVCGDAMEFVRKLPDNCVDIVVTSPIGTHTLVAKHPSL